MKLSADYSMQHTSSISLFIFFLLLTSWSAKAQNVDEVHINKTQAEIKLDGIIDEDFWFETAASKDFYQYFPDNGKAPTYPTELYFSRTEEYLYVGIKCHSRDSEYIVPSLRRDYQAGGSDNITIMFDTFNDGANCIFFGINPEGVAREGTIANGGIEFSDFSAAWDNKWKSKAHKGEKFWSAELKIPFTSLRFKADSKSWRVGAYRFDSQTNEISTIMDVPNNQGITNLAFMKDLIWEEPIAKSSRSISVIPFISGGLVRDFEDFSETEVQATGKIGADAKIAVTTGLNLDLTVNPDFSQVEVDRQVTDLDRFEIFLPERRQFFIENADLFNGFGNSRVNPFFSRRIGIATDTTEGTRIENPVLFGARLSGKINNDWRVGLLNIQTQEDAQNDLPSFNYTAAAVQRKLFANSSVGLIFVNRDNLTNFESETFDDYNRVIGLDYNLATKDNTWNGKAFIHHSLTPIEKEGDEFAHGFEINYTNDLIQFGYNHQYVGGDYDAQVGFVPRTDFYRINPDFRVNFQPSNDIINQHGPGVEYNRFMDTDFKRTDESFDLTYQVQFQNNTRLNFRYRNSYTLLTSDFEIISDQPALTAGSEFNYYEVRFQYRSDRRKPFSYSINPIFGTFFNADLFRLNLDATYRFQPFGSIALQANFSRLSFEDTIDDTNIILIGPRIDITLSKKLFITTFFQFNNQIDNFNINARLQWRFAPVSDFFIVYTDNYNTDGFISRNKALVAKFSYWFSL